jgi:hypothetical protein
LECAANDWLEPGTGTNKSLSEGRHEGMRRGRSGQSIRLRTGIIREDDACHSSVGYVSSEISRGCTYDPSSSAASYQQPVTSYQTPSASLVTGRIPGGGIDRNSFLHLRSERVHAVKRSGDPIFRCRLYDAGTVKLDN